MTLGAFGCRSLIRKSELPGKIGNYGGYIATTREGAIEAAHKGLTAQLQRLEESRARVLQRLVALGDLSDAPT